MNKIYIATEDHEKNKKKMRDGFCLIIDKQVNYVKNLETGFIVKNDRQKKIIINFLEKRKCVLNKICKNAKKYATENI